MPHVWDPTTVHKRPGLVLAVACSLVFIPPKKGSAGFTESHCKPPACLNTHYNKSNAGHLGVYASPPMQTIPPPLLGTLN